MSVWNFVVGAALLGHVAEPDVSAESQTRPDPRAESLADPEASVEPPAGLDASDAAVPKPEADTASQAGLDASGEPVDLGAESKADPDIKANTESPATAEVSPVMQDSAVLLLVAQRYLDRGQPELALQAFDRVLAIDELPAAVYGRAEALRALDRCLEAVASYERVMQLLPQGDETRRASSGGLHDCRRTLSKAVHPVPPPPVSQAPLLREEASATRVQSAQLAQPTQTRPSWKRVGLGVSGGLFGASLVSTVGSLLVARRHALGARQSAEDSLTDDNPLNDVGPYFETASACEAARKVPAGVSSGNTNGNVARSCRHWENAVVATQLSLGLSVASGVATAAFAVVYFVRKTPERRPLGRVRVSPGGVSGRF